MQFSSGIRLSGLDDYLAPSQECIKPVKINRIDTKEPVCTFNFSPLSILKSLKRGAWKTQNKSAHQPRAFLYSTFTRYTSLKKEGRITKSCPMAHELDWRRPKSHLQIALLAGLLVVSLLLTISGCVTSAEAVLVEEQGLPELYRQLASGKKVVVCPNVMFPHL